MWKIYSTEHIVQCVRCMCLGVYDIFTTKSQKQRNVFYSFAVLYSISMCNTYLYICIYIKVRYLKIVR